MVAVVGSGHLDHDPVVEVQGGVALPAFDQPERINAVLEGLIGADIRLTGPESHGDEPILAVHAAGLLEFLREGWGSLAPHRPPSSPLVFGDTFAHERLRVGLGPDARSADGVAGMGWWCFDTITGLGPGTPRAACEAVDVALTAAGFAEQDGAALALTRPPGHHVSRDLFGGGCYLNNAAIAAERLSHERTRRVAVLDLDFHHGNGTQSIFYERPDVLYASLHGAPETNFPFHVGFAEERGTGAGEGANLNLVLPDAADGSAFLRLLDQAIDAVRRHAPRALVVSLGLDVVAEDPSSDARVERDALTVAGQATGALRLPTLIVLEGGYAMSRLGADLRAWLEGFRAARQP